MVASNYAFIDGEFIGPKQSDFPSIQEATQWAYQRAIRDEDLLDSSTGIYRAHLVLDSSLDMDLSSPSPGSAYHTYTPAAERA